MNRILIGLLIGVSVVTGLVVLLMRGKKTQRFLRDRWQQLRSALPETERVQQYAHQVADRVSRAASDVKDTAQQTAVTMKQTGQDVADKTRQLVKQR